MDEKRINGFTWDEWNKIRETAIRRTDSARDFLTRQLVARCLSRDTVHDPNDEGIYALAHHLDILFRMRDKHKPTIDECYRCGGTEGSPKKGELCWFCEGFVTAEVACENEAHEERRALVAELELLDPTNHEAIEALLLKALHARKVKNG
jgi:hypothetical protein